MSEKKSYTEIQKQVDKAYDSLGKRQRLEPNPFLFTRIEERIKEIENPTPVLSFISAKRILQPVLMTLLVAVSLFVGIKIGSINTGTAQTYETYTTEYLLNDMKQEHLVNNLLK